MVLPHTSLLVIFFLVGGGQPSAPQPGAVAKGLSEELMRLQGGWQVEDQMENGQKASPEELKNCTLYIGRDSFLLRRSDKLLQIGLLKLDPTKKQKTINAIIMRGP